MEDKEFQNLLAKRGHLVTLLIATVAGTVGLIYVPVSVVSMALVAIGVLFAANIVKVLFNIESKIDQIVERAKNDH